LLYPFFKSPRLTAFGLKDFDEMVESSVASGLEPLLLGPGVLGLLGLEFSFFNGTKEHFIIVSGGLVSTNSEQWRGLFSRGVNSARQKPTVKSSPHIYVIIFSLSTKTPNSHTGEIITISLTVGFTID
jgi:hypothetical protein